MLFLPARHLTLQLPLFINAISSTSHPVVHFQCGRSPGPRLAAPDPRPPTAAATAAFGRGSGKYRSITDGSEPLAKVGISRHD
jgi:hypothetical protein